jgi:hydrogenase 3 maturation protease
MLPELKGKVLILGVGNPMKQDDGIGPTLISKLKIKNEKLKMNVELLDAGMAPENYSGKIKQIKPDTLVIIDAVDFGGEAGSIKVIEAEQIGRQSLSTHNVSLSTFVDFLKTDLPDLEVLVVGIQPKTANFGEGLSPEVEKAVDKLCMSLV